jgi:hypothetical protein
MHQTCVRVVSPEDGQVMPETCRDFEPKSSVVKVKCASSWLCLLRNYVTMMHGQQYIKKKREWIISGFP